MVTCPLKVSHHSRLVALCPLPHHFPFPPMSFRMNTCKSVSKQTTLTPFRMNTYEKQGEGGRATFLPFTVEYQLSAVHSAAAYESPARPELLEVTGHASSPVDHCIGEAIVPEWPLNVVLTPHRETSPLVPVSKSSRADAGCGNFILPIPGQVSCRQAGPGSIRSGCGIRRAGKAGSVRLGQYALVGR